MGVFLNVKCTPNSVFERLQSFSKFDGDGILLKIKKVKEKIKKYLGEGEIFESFRGDV